jgi:ubiquinone/menaquinone biosynthesis C-methylase UbiE
MDQPGLAAEQVREAHRVLRRVNQQFFGATWVLNRELRAWIDQQRPPGRVTVLDVGAGSGDLLLEARKTLERTGRVAALIALDRDSIPLAVARAGGVGAVRADALRLPLPDCSCDLVCAIKFAHHFTGDRLDRLLAELARVARSRVLVLDIRRSWLAYAGFVAWSRVFTRNELVRYDGPLSVLRAFLPAELLASARSVAGFSWSVRRYAGFQLALVGTRANRVEDEA